MPGFFTILKNNNLILTEILKMKINLMFEADQD